MRLLAGSLPQALCLLTQPLQPPLQPLNLPVQTILILLQLISLPCNQGKSLLQTFFTVSSDPCLCTAILSCYQTADQSFQQSETGQHSIHLWFHVAPRAAGLLWAGHGEGVLAAASVVIITVKGGSVLGLAQGGQSQTGK